MQTYEPQPIDVSGRDLSPELSELMEKLAENAHDVWAVQRMRQGWRFGPSRDDQAREHPCLVPYAELPESERDVDRAAVEHTLKAILTLG